MTTAATHWQGQPALQCRRTDGASATVLLQGGQLVSWRSAEGRERLFCSSLARYGAGSAVRGGVPVIFPQFEWRGPDTSLPRHGFARNRVWQRSGPVPTGDAIGLHLSDDAVTRQIWSGRHRLELTVRLDRDAVEIELACLNVGEAPFDFSAALHTYLAVDDLEAARLEGLQGTRYLDTITGKQDVQATAALVLDGEIDRIHWAAGDRPLVLSEPGHALQIEAGGFPDVVVWNPGSTKAAAMDDLPEGAERCFVCIEAAAIQPPLRLVPGARWVGVQRLTVLR